MIAAYRGGTVIGTPDEVIEQLRAYEGIGVDQYMYWSNFGVPRDLERRSLELFTDEVMPAFR